MDVRISEYLLAIEQAGSISHAAELIHISQSALSQSLHREESAVGTELFRREQNRLVPTEAGRVYLNAASRMVALRDDAYHRIHNLQSGEKGVLRVVVCNQTYALFSQLILDRLTETFSGFEISLSKADSEEALQYLLHDISDVAIFAETETTSSLIMSRDLYQDRLVLAVPRSLPWDREKKLTDNISVCPVILPEKGTYLYSLLPEEVQKARDTVKIYRADDVAEISTLVRHNYGAAFLPERLIKDITGLWIQNIRPERIFHIKTAVPAYSLKKKILAKAQDCICSCFVNIDNIN